MSQVEFFLAQAARETALAAETPLSNVRDRCERSALAWEAMANRAAKTDALRATREAAAAAGSELRADD